MNIKDFILGYLIGKNDGGGGASVEPLTVTENGEYSEEGVAYSPVTVNVAGGLEYEEGTWTPGTDVEHPTISFSNQHTKAPCFYEIGDITPGDTAPANGSAIAVVYCDTYQISGVGLPHYQTNKRYSIIAQDYQNGTTSASKVSMTGHNSDESGDDSTNYPKFWCTNTVIKPFVGDAMYWRSGRSYKWIAVWAPES